MKKPLEDAEFDSDYEHVQYVVPDSSTYALRVCLVACKQLRSFVQSHSETSRPPCRTNMKEGFTLFLTCACAHLSPPLLVTHRLHSLGNPTPRKEASAPFRYKKLLQRETPNSREEESIAVVANIIIAGGGQLSSQAASQPARQTSQPAIQNSRKSKPSKTVQF